MHLYQSDARCQNLCVTWHIQAVQDETYRLPGRLFHLPHLWPALLLLQQALLSRQLLHQRLQWRAYGLQPCFGSLCG